MDRFELLKNLMVMAAVDQKFTEEEVEFLALRSHRWELNGQQVNEALEYARSDNAQLSIPRDPEARHLLLKNLILMMGADGEVNELERRLFARAAAAMDIDSADLNQMIDELL